MTINNQQSTIKDGFSLLEMVVYLGIMTLILVVVVNTLLVILFIEQDIKMLRIIEQSSIIALDRLAREIRDADSVDLGQSQFGVNPGRLTLNTTDDTGNPKIIEFIVENEILRFRENDVLQGPLVNPQVRVTNLVFYNLTASSSQAIKTELTLVAGTGDHIKSETFYLTAAFRGI